MGEDKAHVPWKFPIIILKFSHKLKKKNNYKCYIEIIRHLGKTPRLVYKIPKTNMHSYSLMAVALCILEYYQ